MARSALSTGLATLLPAGGVLTASLLIAWATEVLSFFLSRGLAFAILALLQVLPEFAVEAVITTEAAFDPAHGLRYVTANFTGANRLIVGLFLPLVFIMAAWHARRRGQKLRYVTMPIHSSVEVVALIIPTVYSFSFVYRGEIGLADAVLLIGMYAVYLYIMYKLPPAEEADEELPLVPRHIRRRPVRQQKLIIALFFIVGAVLLFESVHPFYENTLELGVTLGISAYFLVQWLAPFLSEFPEFITITYWGKTGRAELGLTNAISSKVNQWTLLIAMIPIVFVGARYWRFGLDGVMWNVPFDEFQRTEILLTAAQGLFAACVFLNLRFHRWEAATLLGLWAIQLVDPLFDPAIHAHYGDLIPTFYDYDLTGEHHAPPYVREWTTVIYLALSPFVVFVPRHRFAAFRGFAETLRVHFGKHAPPPEAPIADPHLDEAARRP